jgi:hypothetical protein
MNETKRSTNLRENGAGEPQPGFVATLRRFEVLCPNMVLGNEKDRDWLRRPLQAIEVPRLSLRRIFPTRQSRQQQKKKGVELMIIGVE